MYILEAVDENEEKEEKLLSVATKLNIRKCSYFVAYTTGSVF